MVLFGKVRAKLLTLEKTPINLVVYSLNRNFALNITKTKQCGFWRIMGMQKETQKLPKK